MTDGRCAAVQDACTGTPCRCNRLAGHKGKHECQHGWRWEGK